jgi:hypothetical protein
VRTFAGGVLSSTERPALRMRVVPEFTYAGSFAFDLDAVARVERHVFVDTTGDVVRRMIVVHFEAFLPGVDDLYRYKLTDERVLGGATYGRGVSALSVSEERATAPHAEMARTAEYLTAARLVLPDRHVVARYARIVGADRRAELLIFYHECPGIEYGIHARAEATFDLA